MPSRAKPRGKPFTPGRSGNPAGRPKGIRAQNLVILDGLFDDDGPDIVSTVIAAAKAGDLAAARLCLERIHPPRKDRPIHFDLPRIETGADVIAATHALLQGVTSGTITPAEAGEIGKLLDAHMQAIKLHDHEKRLAAIEAASNDSDGDGAA